MTFGSGESKSALVSTCPLAWGKGGRVLGPRGLVGNAHLAWLLVGKGGKLGDKQRLGLGGAPSYSHPGVKDWSRAGGGGLCVWTPELCP